MPLQEIDPASLKDNMIKLIGTDWMLITAGTADNLNTMTAAWGGLGFLWNKPVAIIYIRTQRYTIEFVERASHFSLSFLSEYYRDILTYCGTTSGREVDKIKESGLQPAFTDSGTPYFNEARLVMECKKLYADLIREENFIDQKMLKHYTKKDYHKFYIGEIIHTFIG
ncbi:MAG: flavin reductase family protein [Bacteroidales bacterium]|nr:flavin reductase family protein [Bacteroidales bacterium]